MKKIKVRITEDKHILSITPETTTIGAQYDNESQCLEFERPLEFADTDLILYFGDSRVLPGEQAPEPVNLGAANEWVLMSDLTRCQKLRLQIAFRKNGTELTHSNVITLELRPSISPEPAPAASLPERLATLEASAFTGMAFENSTLTMTTATGGEEKVTVTGGDASFSIPEAPADNKLYGRRNEEWEELTGGAAPEWYVGKNLLVMGDSIPTGWKNQLADQMKASSMHCTAVGGAFVADFADTVHGSDPHSGQARDNVLSNQLLWLKKEIEEGIYTDTPDVIVIQIGTNTNGGASLTFDIEKEFTSDSEYIPLDHLDLVGNFTASYRWALEQLMADDMFPYARVFLCSPPQSALDKRDDADIRFRGDVVRRIARRMSVGFVDLYGCGIYSRWESSEGGRYYTDGVHPVYNQYSGGNKLIVDAIIAAMKNVGDNSPADLETEVNSATRCTFPAGSVLGSSGGRIVPVPTPTRIDYSPTPKLTGNLWHNGEPEYVVSIPIGKLANAGTVSVPHNIPDPAVRIKHNLSMSPFTADDSTVVVTFDAANMNVTTTADLSAVSAWIEIYYVKTGSATLTNLLKNADFSDGTANWNVNAAGTWEVVGDILKGTWTSDTAASRFRAYQQFSSTAFPPDHFYYIRASGRMAVWQNQDGTPATGYRQSGLRIGNAGGSTKLNSGRNGAVWDSMAQYSAVGNTNPDTTFNLFELDYLFPSFVGTGSTYELQNPMLIDLTEDFGAGNEPTKEWCDENIPFFMGELKI